MEFPAGEYVLKPNKFYTDVTFDKENTSMFYSGVTLCLVDKDKPKSNDATERTLVFKEPFCIVIDNDSTFYTYGLRDNYVLFIGKRFSQKYLKSRLHEIPQEYCFGELHLDVEPADNTINYKSENDPEEDFILAHELLHGKLENPELVDEEEDIHDMSRSQKMMYMKELASKLDAFELINVLEFMKNLSSNK